jgi:glucokinase
MVAIGVDVGGTKCLAVALGEDGSVVDSLTLPTAEGIGVVEEVAELCTALALRVGKAATSLGVGMPGTVSRDGVVYLAPHLPDVRQLPMRELLASKLSIPVVVDNDATCAGVAEWKKGAAQNCNDALIITIGTGIGAALIANGKVMRGHHGFAGESGHHIVVHGGEECPCGRRGCWEQYASGTALRRMANGVSGEEVLLRVVKEDAQAQIVLEEFASWVALGLFNLVNTLDPQVIVLGGGLGSSAVLRHFVANSLSKQMPPAELRPAPLLVTAQLGPEAGAIGAALLGKAVIN